MGTVLACGLTLQTVPSQAHELTDSLAISFKTKGDRAIDAGDFDAAARNYAQGDQIQHHPSFDFNLARAYQGLGRFPEALDALERFESEASSELKAKVPGLNEMLARLRGSVGVLVLEGDPRTARVFGNGRDLGMFEPGKRIRCNLGPLTIKVEANGQLPIVERVTIDTDQIRTVHLTWVRDDDRAIVTIKASVPATSVTIDGRHVGQTPVEVKLPAGTHRLVLEHPDCQSLTTELIVAPRESRQVSFDMSKNAPLWSRWWFWSGAAAVAAGVIIVGVALSTTKSATPGDIQPGIVSAPLTQRH